MNDIINGVPLVAVVIGLVEWFKRFGIGGNALMLVSMSIGLILGGAYQYAVNPPADFADWLGLVVYGLMLGLVASGIYDAFKGHHQV